MTEPTPKLGVFFRVTCPECETLQVLAISQEEYENWQNGMLIQDAMPNLTRAQRETLMSGTCPKCWSDMVIFAQDVYKLAPSSRKKELE